MCGEFGEGGGGGGGNAAIMIWLYMAGYVQLWVIHAINSHESVWMNCIIMLMEGPIKKKYVNNSHN